VASAVGTADIGVAVLRRRGRPVERRRAERRHVYGEAVFGLGFGVGATCPGITVAMTVTGRLYELIVLTGLFAGLWLRGLVERRAAQPLSPEPMLPPAPAPAH
jgi:uncharacterized membrane protein YedE/YeeE